MTNTEELRREGKITFVEHINWEYFSDDRFIKFKGIGSFGARYLPSGQLRAESNGKAVKNCPFDIVAVERKL